MRCLVVRFIDCEGPGLLERVLRKKKYTISYHDAFKPDLKIIPNAHQIFDLLILMGGPQSVDDKTMDRFFSPYYDLINDILSNKKAKIIGVCLGSQILAKFLGGKVQKGDNGSEVGFSKVEILDKSDSVFQGISENFGTAFHLHEDTFTIPANAKLLLSSAVYKNQMFSFEDRVFGIQCHLEATYPMIEVWSEIHSDFIAKSSNASPVLDKKLQSDAEAFGEKIFENILNK